MQHKPPNPRDYPILYVDDEIANTVVFEESFGEDFEILVAPSGAEALQTLERQRVAILITDHRMPEMTGVELCERVREVHPNLARVLVTAYSDHQTAIDAINQGRVQRYITKPWHAADVRRALHDLVVEAHIDRMVRELRAAMTERERLASVAAARAKILHDLANAHVVVGAACDQIEALLARAGDPAQTWSAIRDEVASLRSVVDHIHGIYEERRRVGRDRQARTSHVALELLDRVVDLVDVHSPHNLAIDCDETLVVYADGVDVTRIIVNLITNALQAVEASSGDAAAIRISGRSKGDRVVIEVRDNGPGVPEAIRERAFEMFVTTKSERGGSGLGLAICRELAQENEGSIDFCDNEDGVGTTFRLELPAFLPRG